MGEGAGSATSIVTAVGARGVTDQPAWKALEEHHRKIRDWHLRELFARDPNGQLTYFGLPLAMTDGLEMSLGL